MNTLYIQIHTYLPFKRGLHAACFQYEVHARSIPNPHGGKRCRFFISQAIEGHIRMVQSTAQDGFCLANGVNGRASITSRLIQIYPRSEIITFNFK